MKHRHGKGTWPDNCPKCGCSCVITQNDNLPKHRRIVWAWETFDPNQRALERLHAILDQLGLRVPALAPQGAPDGICDNPECCCPWWTINGKRVWGYELAEERRQAVETLEAKFTDAVPDSLTRLALRLPHMESLHWCWAGDDG